jgi:DNA modification methylase
VKLPISKLVNNTGQIEGLPANPRQIDKTDYERLLKSLKEDPDFLTHKPLHVYEHDDKYVVLGGNQRLRALKELGYKEVPVTVYEPETPVEVLKRRIIIDNSTFGDYDMDMLANEGWETDELVDWGVDLPEDWLEQEPEIEEDEAPEVSDQPPVSKLGEVYQLGRHRVGCMDSTVKENVELLMNGEKADMVFTDPPYGVNFQSNMRTKSDKFDVLKNDDVILDFIPAVKDVLEGFIYICTTWRVYEEWAEILKKHYDITNVVIWNKGGGGLGDLLHTFSTDYEIILVSNNGKELTGKRYGSVWNIGKKDITKMTKSELLDIAKDIQRHQSVWDIKKDASSSYEHPTQKPVGVSAKAIQSSSEIDGSVLDLFLGSGSTLIACEQTDRTCYGMELDEKYLDVVRKRWAKYVYPERWENEWEILTPAIEKL